MQKWSNFDSRKFSEFPTALVLIFTSDFQPNKGEKFVQVRLSAQNFSARTGYRNIHIWRFPRQIWLKFYHKLAQVVCYNFGIYFEAYSNRLHGVKIPTAKLDRTFTKLKTKS